MNPRRPDDVPATASDASSGTTRQLLTRRNVVVGAGVVAALGLVGGGALVARDQYLRFGTKGEAVRDRRVKVPASLPRLVIARGADPKRNVSAALGKLGGMKQFVKKGDVVVVKPNIGWDRVPAQAGNTDPAVVAALVRACRDAGAREVIVTDCPVHDPARTFQRSGIEKAARDAGARVVRPNGVGTSAIEISSRLGNWPVLEPFVTADKIINVPVAKDHGSVRVSAGMKNWIGITLHQRSRFHTDLDRSIAELALLMRPTLTVVDAHRVLMRNGPRGGNLDDVKAENALAMSLDPVAVDAWASDLLGVPHDRVPYLRLAEGLGLGTTKYKSLNPVKVTTG